MINFYKKSRSQLSLSRLKTLKFSAFFQHRDVVQKDVVQKDAIQKIQYLILGVLISGFNIWMMLLLLQPTSLKERQFVIQYSEQALYPQSRVIAQHWRDSPEPPTRYMYFKFLRTLAAEQRAVHRVATDQEKINQ